MNEINIMELLKTAAWHSGFSKGIDYAVEEITKQVNAQQGAEGVTEENEGSPVQEM